MGKYSWSKKRAVIANWKISKLEAWKNILSAYTIYLYPSIWWCKTKFRILSDCWISPPDTMTVQGVLILSLMRYREEQALEKRWRVKSTLCEGCGFAGHFLPFARNLRDSQKDLWQSLMKLSSMRLDIEIYLYMVIYLLASWRTWQQREINELLQQENNSLYPVIYNRRGTLEFRAYMSALRSHFII